MINKKPVLNFKRLSEVNDKTDTIFLNSLNKRQNLTTLVKKKMEIPKYDMGEYQEVRILFDLPHKWTAVLSIYSIDRKSISDIKLSYNECKIQQITYFINEIAFVNLILPIYVGYIIDDEYSLIFETVEYMDIVLESMFSSLRDKKISPFVVCESMKIINQTIVEHGLFNSDVFFNMIYKLKSLIDE